MKNIICTNQAPAAIGTYSQAVRCENTVYCSGQIGLDPQTMELATGFTAQAHQVFKNLAAIAVAAGGSLDQIVKLTVYLVDLQQFAELNSIMASYFSAPYPARAAIQVTALPKGAVIEIDAILHLTNVSCG